VSRASDWIVAIPSYRRVRCLQDKTLDLLDRGGVDPARIVVYVADDDERERYAGALRKGSYGRIAVSAPTLPKSRNAIQRDQPPGQRIVWLDDDIRSLVRRVNEKQLQVEPDTGSVFTEGFSLLERTGSQLWGIYPVPNAMFMKPRIRTGLVFCVGYCYGTINQKEPIDGLIYGKEDYERCVEWYLRTGPLVRMEYVAGQTAVYTEAGGNQSADLGDRKLRNDRAVDLMLAKYRGLVQERFGRKSGFREIRLVEPKR